MAKKAATVSWRTLTRKADKATNPRTASRLRKQAHELRRSVRKIAASRATPPNVSTGLSSSQKRTKKKAAPGNRTIKSLAREAHKAGLAVQIRSIPTSRGAKAWATRRANAIKKAAADGGLAGIAALKPQGINRQDSPAWHVTTDRGLPGQGELVGGAFSQLADRISKLSRKKGGTDAIQNELAALASSSKYEGCVETDKAATKRLVEVQERMAERILCGFIAEVDTCTAQHHGLPVAMTWNLNSFLIVKIVDALNKAGYRATGKT